MNKALRRWAAGAGLLALVAGCSSTAATKSGVAPDPVTLTLASNDGHNLDGAPGVEHFVERLGEISGGIVTVDVASTWKGGADEVRVLESVAAGEADLGWAGTRALDQIGVETFTPLQAPFLVDSYNAQRDVLSDPQVQSALGDLDAAGLTGLALVADELRLPVGVSRPFGAPEDYEAAEFRTVKSAIQSEGIAALGAEPVSTAFLPTMDGAELMLWTYLVYGLFDFAPFPTINTPLWPRSVVLVANPDRLEGLDPQVRDWVEAAAADAAAWSVAHARDREAEQIEAACSSGARIVEATPDQIEALRAQVQPVYDRLADDPATAEMFAQVQRLADRATPDEPATIPSGCAFQPGDEALAGDDPTQLTEPGARGDLPEGVYRYELTEEFLRGAGLPENDVYINAGVFTWTLRGGRWSYEQQPLNDNVGSTTCEGLYAVEGQSFTGSVSTIQDVGECAPLLWTATWSFEGDTLTWSDVSVGDFGPVYEGPEGWTKIG